MASNPYGQKNAGGWCGCGASVEDGQIVIDTRFGGCGRIFTGLRGFNAHAVNRTGQPGYDPEYDWRCSTDAELEVKGYAPDERGWWGSTRADARFDRPSNTRTPVEAEDVKRAEVAR